MIVKGNSDVGLRKSINQDAIFYTTEKIGILPNLFIVADGMGGYKAGDFASQFVVENICNEIKSYVADDNDIVAILNAIIIKVDKMLTEKATSDEKYKGMGSTLVLATIIDNELIVANIGDSRLYLLGDELYQITQDHSLVMDLLKKSLITYEELRIHPERHKITRAMGYGGYPDFYRVTVKRGDKILLCTDGLTKMLSDKEISETIINENYTMDSMVEELVDLANKNGGIDNISIILVDID